MRRVAVIISLMISVLQARQYRQRFCAPGPRTLSFRWDRPACSPKPESNLGRVVIRVGINCGRSHRERTILGAGLTHLRLDRTFYMIIFTKTQDIGYYLINIPRGNVSEAVRQIFQ